MTDTAMQTINLNQLNKADWQSFRFDHIAKSVSERVDPNNTDIEVYIGLEHLDSESLHIKRMGTPADVKGQKLRCYPGDIIFGKRRAYQRKAAIATTEAICSAHAMVLRANPAVIDPKLFPFFLHSDQFMHRAIDISVGSLSPTINWKTLREQEFLLPPKAQQAEVAELLWAMDEVLQREIVAHKAMNSLYEGVSGRVFSRNVEKFRDDLPFSFEFESWSAGVLDDVCSLITDGAHASPKTSELGFPIGTVENMLGDRIDTEACRIISESDYNSLVRNNCQPRDGDVLFSKDGTIGKTFVFKQPDKLVLLSSVAIIRPEPDLLDAEYCSLMLESPVFITEIEKRKSGTALKRVVLKDIRKFRLRLPPVSEQMGIATYLMDIKRNMNLLCDRSEHSNSLKKSLINQVF